MPSKEHGGGRSSSYDWIVVGGGLAGSAAAYELARRRFTVLLLEGQSPLQATRYSYGGIPYWAGTTPLMQQLCQEGIARHRALPEELEADTQLRDLDLLLTIAANQDPGEALKTYADCQISPTLISVSEACDREPQLNPAAIVGALTVRHGHVDPIRLISAYWQAFFRLGGKVHRVTATEVRQQNGCAAVLTPDEAFTGANVLVCAGGLSRHLLTQAGHPVRQYFTHAELLETAALPPALRTIVMPAHTQRFDLEAEAAQPQHESLWQQAKPVAAPILDPGAVQFLDGRLCIGQISRTLGDPFAAVDLAESEARIRQAVGQVLPALATLPARCHHCLVAFSGDRLPLIGPVPGADNLHLFSGFGSPFAILPTLAQRFAAHAAAAPDDIIVSLSPRRPSLLLDHSGG
ncbi:MAG: NAD(P)/FAD-dependent oxidoreductase [Elainellaceae cyanobacterium]